MYIRTKDGRILDFDKLNEISKLSIDMAKEPIREAKTIEELCDEFVVECFNKSYHAISEIGYDELKHNTQTLSPTDTIYGAIWCEWGLKYVAKMNDKGELELIWKLE